MGSVKKGILLLPDLQGIGKGRFLKLSDKHGLGKTHLSIFSGETSLGHLGGQGFCWLTFLIRWKL